MKSVSNTLALVELIAKHQPCSLADLSDLTGLPKTTVQRNLTTLKAAGWIHPHSITGKPGWLLSAHLLSLFTQDNPLTKLQATAKPWLEQLRKVSNESVFLSKFESTGMVVIDYLESQQTVKTTATLGISAPLHATSTGKACLAMLSEEALKKLLRPTLQRYTNKTITDPTKLRKELHAIRTLGYSLSKGEWLDDIANIGSVITDSKGQPIAGLGITVPAFRFHTLDKERIGSAVHHACRTISQTWH